MWVDEGNRFTTKNPDEIAWFMAYQGAGELTINLVSTFASGTIDVGLRLSGELGCAVSALSDIFQKPSERNDAKLAVKLTIVGLSYIRFNVGFDGK